MLKSLVSSASCLEYTVVSIDVLGGIELFSQYQRGLSIDPKIQPETRLATDPSHLLSSPFEGLEVIWGSSFRPA